MKRGAQLAHQLFSELLHHMTKRLALKRSIRNQALMIGTVAQHPRFADRPIARKRRGEQAGQATAAPQDDIDRSGRTAEDITAFDSLFAT